MPLPLHVSEPVSQASGGTYCPLGETMVMGAEMGEVVPGL